MITQAEKTNEDIYLSDADDNKGITFIKGYQNLQNLLVPARERRSKNKIINK